MFGIDTQELLVIAVVALIVIGPKDLPRVMRTIGHWVGRAKGVARHFRSGFDQMLREADLEEMEKKWRADNEAIMRDYPTPSLEYGNGELSGYDPIAEEIATADAATRDDTAPAAPELPFDQPVPVRKPQVELP